MRTDPDKCHISHVVCDTDSWEQKMAQTLEDMPEVVHYVKNHNLGFFIPYTFNGEEHRYIPDFIVRVRPDERARPTASRSTSSSRSRARPRRRRRRRWRRPAPSGCRPSTTTAASAAGPSSRSATRGTRRGQSEGYLGGLLEAAAVMNKGQGQLFGGDWTEDKLRAGARSTCGRT